MHPQKLLTFVAYTNKPPVTRVFRLQQGMEFAQGRPVSANSLAVFQGGRIGWAYEFRDFRTFAEGGIDDVFAEIQLFLDGLVTGFIQLQLDRR